MKNMTWEAISLRLRPSTPLETGTRSVRGAVPTQSVGTRNLPASGDLGYLLPLPYFAFSGEIPADTADCKDSSKFADYDADTKFADDSDEAALGS